MDSYKNKTISNAVAWSGRFGLLERRPDPLFLRLKKIVYNSMVVIDHLNTKNSQVITNGHQKNINW